MPCEFTDRIMPNARIPRSRRRHPPTGDQEKGCEKSEEPPVCGLGTRRIALPTTKPFAMEENSENTLFGGRPASMRIPLAQIAAWVTPFTTTLPTTVADSQR